IFTMDMVLMFRVAYQDPETGMYIVDGAQIAWHYAT
ncbi:hypothetical protein HaLaN_11130, partial [Haematococcus lacustris]